MKKTFSIILISFALLFLFSQSASAIACFSGPAGPGVPYHPDVANSLVPCGQYPDCPCNLNDFFAMVLRVYKFIIWNLALPLAGILIVFGGTLLLVSGIDPKWHALGNQMLWGAAIGLGFIFGSWLIVNIVLRAIGYQGNWFTF